MTEKILVVDDDEMVRAFTSTALARNGITSSLAANGLEALSTLKANTSIQVVLSDLNMPALGGLALIRRAREEISRDLEFVVMTGREDRDAVLQALRLGVSEFLSKPAKSSEVLNAVLRATQTARERIRQRRELRHAKRANAYQKIEISALTGQLEHSHRESLDRIGVLAAHKDNETATHCQRVGAYARELARLAGWTEEMQRRIEMAAPRHDTGKVAVPDSILLNPGELTPDEWDVIKRHTTVGFDMLAGSSNPIMEMAATVALSHHERWDGSGYPHGLSGADISEEARVVGICDVYDALRSKRPYKQAFSHETAMRIMTQGDERTSPDHFDPTLLTLFATNHLLFDQIHRTAPNEN